MSARTHPSSRLATTLAVTGLLAFSGASMAQSAPATDKPAPTPTTPAPATPAVAPTTESSLLGGPRVVDKPARTSIVERDATGSLVRLETRPEQAAIDLLGLTRSEREPVDKILTERLTKVTQLLRENQALFLKIQGARQGGARPAEMGPLMQEFRPLARPFVENPLRDQIAAALPEGKRVEFKQLVAEYIDAAVAEEAANRADKEKAGDEQAPALRAGPGATPEMVARRAEVNLLLREMGGALRTIVKERREQTEELMRAIDATPEQQAQIQAITRDARYGEGFERTPQQMGDIKRRIDAVLTPGQRQKLEEFRRAQGMGRGDPGAPNKPAAPEGEMMPPPAQK